MKRLHLIISGRVQGVLYRDFARREAEKLDISGYAKNLNDGTVEIVAEGSEENLKKMVNSCKKGPLMAFVKNIDAKEESATNEFDGFDIRR
ncbi:acylphosphatase [Candidatus Woesearchaeota archaeon]|nr:acylphosphatase [Candidatus Woesearchaeota archaeon]|tara:strand:+ start:61299 stop:61571 length:273 start_codon:yes stop_codon:yes gene_type:complete